MPQPIQPRLQPLRPAHHFFALPLASPRPIGARRCLHIEIDIVGHHQIQPAIPVIIDKSATRPPARTYTSRCNILKGPITAIAIQHVLTPVSDIQVYKAIVIDVPGANPLAPTSLGHSRLPAHILKGPIALVAIKPIDGLFTRRKSVQPGRCYRKHIQQAIVIEIQKRDAGAKRFHNVVFLRRIAANENVGQSGPQPLFHKPGPRRGGSHQPQ